MQVALKTHLSHRVFAGTIFSATWYKVARYLEMKMKISKILFAIVIMTLTLSCGNALAKESGKQPKACEKKFSELDSTHRGYLVPETFRRELEGSPKQNNKILPYGKVRDAFAAAR